MVHNELQGRDKLTKPQRSRKLPKNSILKLLFDLVEG
jgi:hypothetical protein